MYAQELFVHDCGEGKAAERVHAGFVDPVAVLVLALELEGEVVGQMPALVIAAEEEEVLEPAPKEVRRFWAEDLRRMLMFMGVRCCGFA